MVVTISNNMITTMIGGVVERVAHEVVGGAMVLVVEVEIMMTSKNHHQVVTYVCRVSKVYVYTFYTANFTSDKRPAQ